MHTSMTARRVTTVALRALLTVTLALSALAFVSVSDAHAATAKWVKTGGVWKYKTSHGTYATGWISTGGHWYYLNAKGVMQTGWFKDGQTWYFANSSGAMQTGWLKWGDSWYYLGKSGAAYQNKWLSYRGSWYYFVDSCAMATGWAKAPDANWYFFNTQGAMKTGWIKWGGSWYYLKSSGAMAHDVWQGNYYLTSSGAMATNTWIGKYHVNASGLWDKTDESRLNKPAKPAKPTTPAKPTKPSKPTTPAKPTTPTKPTKPTTPPETSKPSSGLTEAQKLAIAEVKECYNNRAQISDGYLSPKGLLEFVTMVAGPGTERYIAADAAGRKQLEEDYKWAIRHSGISWQSDADAYAEYLYTSSKGGQKDFYFWNGKDAVPYTGKIQWSRAELIQTIMQDYDFSQTEAERAADALKANWKENAFNYALFCGAEDRFITDENLKNKLTAKQFSPEEISSAIERYNREIRPQLS